VQAYEHPIAEDIIKILQDNNVWFETFNHEPVRTSEEAAALRPGYTMEQGAKALIARIKVPNQGKSFVMLVLPGNKRFSKEKVSKVTGAKDIRFATEEEVSEITNGVKPGGVPPFGNLFGLRVISDASLYENEKIVFNAGRTTTVAMKSDDYARLVKPAIEDVAAL
jgi:prolyl-tRNA editing enzyme YbaK/EbsC (Cys-tRNA(Pro) deacylase)